MEDPALGQAAVLLAVMPAMGVYPIRAQRYGQARRAALAMFAMTALSFLTISAWMGAILP